MAVDDFLLTYIVSKIHKPQSLVFGFVVGILTFAAIDGFLEKFLSNIIVRLLIYLLILLLWMLYWSHYRFCLPKNNKDKVGFVVAIHAEDNYEENRLKKDLIDNLKRSISDNNLDGIINIVVLKNHFSELITKDVKKSVKQIEQINKKIKGHFYIWGKAKRRNDGGSKYFLELDGLVVHKPTSINAHSDLSREFIALLPKQISFLESEEYSGFRVTADIIYLTSRYIIGVAAYISGDPHLAIQLHSNLRDEFNRLRPLPIHIQKIRDSIPSWLANEELIIARNFYYKNDFLNMEVHVKKALEVDPNNYGAWLLKGIIDFAFKNDPPGAIISIKKAQKYSKTTGEWRYSLAFLQLWLGKYPEAIKNIEKIAKHTYLNEMVTVLEVEEFNLGLLRSGKFKIQLYFWLGFLNYKKKNNLPKALEYLEEFERLSTLEMSSLRHKSVPYLVEIKKQISISQE